MKKVLEQDWLRMNDATFLAFTGRVHNSLSNHPDFSGTWSDLFPSLAEYKRGIDEFARLRDEAVNKDLVKVALRKKSRLDLETMTFRIAQYAEIVTGGDPVKLMNTGFTVHTTGNKTTAGKTVSGEVTNFRVWHAPLPGQVYVSWRRVASRVGVYELQMNYGNINDEGSWLPAGTHVLCAKNLITNLQSVSRVAFRVRYVDHIAGPWTTPVTIVVL